jgi:hypothetical protein
MELGLGDGTDLSEILARSSPPVRGATVIREFGVDAAEQAAGGGTQSDG